VATAQGPRIQAAEAGPGTLRCRAADAAAAAEGRAADCPASGLAAVRTLARWDRRAGFCLARR
jgi:hypothetical protein